MHDVIAHRQASSSSDIISTRQRRGRIGRLERQPPRTERLWSVSHSPLAVCGVCARMQDEKHKAISGQASVHSALPCRNRRLSGSGVCEQQHSVLVPSSECLSLHAISPGRPFHLFHLTHSHSFERGSATTNRQAETKSRIYKHAPFLANPIALRRNQPHQHAGRHRTKASGFPPTSWHFRPSPHFHRETTGAHSDTLRGRDATGQSQSISGGLVGGIEIARDASRLAHDRQCDPHSHRCWRERRICRRSCLLQSFSRSPA